MNPSPRNFDSTRLAWAGFTLIYYVSVCLAHLQFSLWLVRARGGDQGSYAFADAMPTVVIAGLVGLVLWLVRVNRRQPDRIARLALWIFWGFCVFLCDRFLTFSINEYAHYPQYGILAWLLARCLDPQRKRLWVGRVVFWVTLMGAADEGLQYLWITTSYSHYLDFNDFLVNLLSAAAGAMVYYAKTPSLTGQQLRGDTNHAVEMAMLSGLVLALVLAMASGRLVVTPAAGQTIAPGGIQANAQGAATLYLQRSDAFYGSWQKAPRHGRYKVLSPLPGVLLVLMAGAVFSRFGRRAKN